MLYHLDAEPLEEAEAVAVALLAVFGVAPGEVAEILGTDVEGAWDLYDQGVSRLEGRA
jgi:hypothetical protein